MFDDRKSANLLRQKLRKRPKNKRRERDPELTMDIKIQLAGQQNWRCCNCGSLVGLAHHIREEQPSNQRLATFEHLMPKEIGGTNDVSNLAISCGVCNDPGQSVWERWFQEICEFQSAIPIVGSARTH